MAENVCATSRVNLMCVCVCVIIDQKNMGMSMKIERSTLDQVKKRFETNKKKKDEEKKQYG